jgi:hypothetical protein
MLPWQSFGCQEIQILERMGIQALEESPLEDKSAVMRNWIKS